MDLLAEDGDVASAVMGVAFPAGNDDFRAARDRCSQACRRFNETPEDSPGEIRSRRFLDIIRPGRDRADDAGAAITHDMTFRNPKLKAQTPFVKPPFFVDYGLRVRIGGSTFINRSCMIMDTPVADMTIGERCNIGPNCVIVSVSHALRAEDRAGKQNSIGKPITIGDHVWIGANVTILGGVTIGDGAVIGAGSVITRDIPARTMAVGVPARVVQDLTTAEAGACDYDGTVNSLTEAMMHGRQLDRKEEADLARLSVKLSLLQRQKLAQQQQQLKAEEAQQEEQAVQVRRGSDAPSPFEFRPHSQQPVMLLLAAMLVALITSMATIHLYRL